ncbi:MAG: hypothetical protein AAGG02_07940 [Cyanobacteria bacterium P01_H01_bin.15]
MWKIYSLGLLALVPQVGLKIDASPIISSFSGRLIEYIGDCPGWVLDGAITRGDFRSISQTTPPAKELRVVLTNLRTAQNVERTYRKTNRGSHDFGLSKLGNSPCDHEISYQIFNKETKAVLETGRFVYTVEIDEYEEPRNAQWKRESICLGGGSRSNCEIFLIVRDRKVCPDGNIGPTVEIRNEQFIDYRPGRRNRR